VGAQEGGALAGGQVLTLCREEGTHRGLGIDDEVLVAGQPHHDVRAHLALVPAHAAHLLVEVTPGEQPGVLQDPAQLHLAPGASNGRGVERTGQ
jgi:hypothetical protein